MASRWKDTFPFKELSLDESDLDQELYNSERPLLGLLLNCTIEYTGYCNDGQSFWPFLFSWPLLEALRPVWLKRRQLIKSKSRWSRASIINHHWERLKNKVQQCTLISIVDCLLDCFVGCFMDCLVVCLVIIIRNFRLAFQCIIAPPKRFPSISRLKSDLSPVKVLTSS